MMVDANATYTDNAYVAQVAIEHANWRQKHFVIMQQKLLPLRGHFDVATSKVQHPSPVAYPSETCTLFYVPTCPFAFLVVALFFILYNSKMVVFMLGR